MQIEFALVVVVVVVVWSLKQHRRVLLYLYIRKTMMHTRAMPQSTQSGVKFFPDEGAGEIVGTVELVGIGPHCMSLSGVQGFTISSPSGHLSLHLWHVSHGWSGEQ